MLVSGRKLLVPLVHPPERVLNLQRGRKSGVLEEEIPNSSVVAHPHQQTNKDVDLLKINKGLSLKKEEGDRLPFFVFDFLCSMKF